MTQNDKILNHLRDHGGITSMEAYEIYGCTRLSARIKDLRDAGFVFKATRETGRNRDGEKVSYARYQLHE